MRWFEVGTGGSAASVAALELGDRAVTHGLGLFETMLAVDRRIIAWDLHAERLAAGADRLGLVCSGLEVVRQCLEERLGAGQERVRLMVTAGPGGLTQLAGGGGRWLASLVPCPEPPESVSVVVSPWPLNHRSPLVGVKALSYAENLIAMDFAHRAGADEAFVFNDRGDLAEAAMANVFWVEGGVLATPALTTGCLPGTARRRVIDLAASLGIEVREAALRVEELPRLREIFLTSATRGPVPVTRVGAAELEVGAVTAQLRDAFWDQVRRG